MAFDTYMQVGDGSVVVGEATASGVPTGSFEIFSFSLGASNPTTVGPGTTGLSAGRVSVSSFNVMKRTDKGSTAMFAACCNGQHFPNAKVILRKAVGTGGQKVFLEYDFTDVMVESIQWSGSSGGDDTPTESVSFSFAQIAINYSTQDTAAGTVTPAGSASWDLTTVSK